MTGTLKIVTWNVKGANLAMKRKKLMIYLKQKRADIALLQETHLDTTESKKLQRDWVGQIFYSTFSSSKRGVIILIRKTVNIKVYDQKSDTEGRWVAIDVDLMGRRCSLVNIYAPNTDSPEFFYNLHVVIQSMGNTDIIIGGDFNQVRHNTLDRSGNAGRSRNIQKSQIAIDTVSEELGLVDVWRLMHPQEREYTFFSNPHASYSRIDYFLISKQLVPIVEQTSIGNIVITDHGPVDMTLRFKSESERRSTRWRLNTCQLQNENSCQFIRQQILDYWEINEGTVDDPGVVWDAFKAYLRGRLIQHSSFLKKQASDQLSKLEAEIKDLEREYADRGDQKLLANLSKAKFELNTIMQRKAEFSLFRCRQKYYEQGERAGKLLAQRVKQQQAQTLISAIQNEKGEILTDTIEINNAFQLFYQNLYTSQDSWDRSEFQNFLSRATLPALTELARERLGACITLGEVQQAIGCLGAGRSPGGDGFPTDFYKSFSDLLAPRLLTVFQDAFQRGSLPESMQNAIITLIHKKGKDPLWEL